jgi:hypothetical protein
MVATYSPLPIESYRLAGVEISFVDAISDHDLNKEIWNLFWLSNHEALAKVPGSGKGWHRHYQTVPGGLAAVIRDVEQDIILFKQLGRPAPDFLRWFRQEDVSVYDCFDVYGEDLWRDTVMAGAHEASRRVLTVSTGNVVYAQFGKRA